MTQMPPPLSNCSEVLPLTVVLVIVPVPGNGQPAAVAARRVILR